MYKIMKDRIYFYYNRFNNKILPPKEKCSTKLHRIIFSRRPPPYYYDYRIEGRSLAGKCNIVLLMRKRFGYGKRKQSSRPSLMKPTEVKLSLVSVQSTQSDKTSNNEIKV